MESIASKLNKERFDQEKAELQKKKLEEDRRMYEKLKQEYKLTEQQKVQRSEQSNKQIPVMQKPRPLLRKPKVSPKVDQGKHPFSDLNLEPELAVGRIISLDFMCCIGAAYLLDHESTSCLSKHDKHDEICGLKDSRTRILSIFLLCKCFLVD